MPRATWIQTGFNAGEWSPTLYGRVDLQKYRLALQLCKRYIPWVQGALTRCPGTEYIAAAKVTTKVRLQRFEFSTTQAYILEFGNNYLRFYTEGGQLLDAGSPYEVTTTYTEAELDDMQFTQSADILYIVHPSHPPQELKRLGATSWTLTPVDFQDGPYLPRNLANNYLTATSSTPGTSSDLTFDNTDSINGGAGFTSADVGRLIRFENSTTGASTQFLWAVITAVTDTTHITVTIKNLAAI